MSCDSWTHSAPHFFNSNMKLSPPVLILLWGHCIVLQWPFADVSEETFICLQHGSEQILGHVTLHRTEDKDESEVRAKLYRNPFTKVGYAVEQLVEALRYKPEGRGFDFRFSLTQPLNRRRWPVRGDDKFYHLHVPIVIKSWAPQPPGTLRARPGLYRDCFTFTFLWNYFVTNNSRRPGVSFHPCLSLPNNLSYLPPKFIPMRALTTFPLQ